MPWLTQPDEWHPQETRWVQTYCKRCSPGSWQYRNSRFASQILRRLPGLCPLPRAYGHDLWFNRFGDTCSVQFESAFGATHDFILDKILDPVFGPGAEIALFKGQTTAGCYAGTEYPVTVRSAGEPSTWIALRRATRERQADDEDPSRTFGMERRRFRDAIEAITLLRSRRFLCRIGPPYDCTQARWSLGRRVSRLLQADLRNA